MKAASIIIPYYFQSPVPVRPVCVVCVCGPAPARLRNRNGIIIINLNLNLQLRLYIFTRYMYLQHPAHDMSPSTNTQLKAATSAQSHTHPSTSYY